MALTQESVLTFLLERGGKVRNSELVNHFKSLINGGAPAEKQHNRELFKRLVNSVAVVRHIDEVKFVVVKKRYQDFVKDVQEEEDSQETQMDGRFSSFAHAPPVRAELDRRIYGAENNRDREERRSVSDSTAVKVLSVSGERPCRAGKSGAVFAVIAVKSPGRRSAPATHETSNTKAPLNHNFSFKVDSFKKSQSWESKEETYPSVSHLVRPQNNKTRSADDDASKFSESVPLDPLAHEWLVKCAAGLWGQIYSLLLRDTRLVQRKDFMSGFTALHWAAKAGNRDMIHKLMEISSRKGTHVNVNCKSHGGYTPLHIAAMHGHHEVVILLVQLYGANVNERDNDGKKAFHYLEKGASAEVKGLLGGLMLSREKTGDEEDKEYTKGFNTISKLFHPHSGRKHKTLKFAHEW